MGYLATATASSLLRLSQEIQVIPVTTARSLGRVSTEEGTARTFKGILALPGDWKQSIQPGGVTSTTEVILVVSQNARDSLGITLDFDKEDVIVTENSQRYRVTRQVDTTSQYGVKIYELTEMYE